MHTHRLQLTEQLVSRSTRQTEFLKGVVAVCLLSLLVRVAKCVRGTDAVLVEARGVYGTHKLG